MGGCEERGGLGMLVGKFVEVKQGEGGVSGSILLERVREA